MVFRITVYIILGAILISGYIKYIEARSIFFPDKAIYATPEAVNLAFEDIYFNTEDGLKINAWFVPYPRAEYTLLLFHGNAGNIADRLDKIRMLRDLGVNVFIMDYRGYGLSEGRPAERGLYLDASSAYRYLIDARQIEPERIILYGESLGTAVAVEQGSVSQVKGIILEGAFSCARDMAKTIYPFLPPALFSDRFNSIGKIKKIKAPVLFLHSKEDEIVPWALARKLFAAANEPKYFSRLKGGHNTAFWDDREEYLSAISFFLNKPNF